MEASKWKKARGSWVFYEVIGEGRDYYINSGTGLKNTCKNSLFSWQHSSRRRKAPGAECPSAQAYKAQARKACWTLAFPLFPIKDFSGLCGAWLLQEVAASGQHQKEQPYHQHQKAAGLSISLPHFPCPVEGRKAECQRQKHTSLLPAIITEWTHTGLFHCQTPLVTYPVPQTQADPSPSIISM